MQTLFQLSIGVCVCVCVCVSLVNQALLKKIQRKRRKRGRPGSRSYVCVALCVCTATYGVYVCVESYVRYGLCRDMIREEDLCTPSYMYFV